jgi:hypothetical protein
MNTSVTGTVSLTGTTLSNPQWSNGNMTVTYTVSDLAYATTYTFAISGFKDVTGNEMAAVASGHSFTTIWEKLATPNASIDFVNEKLTGLTIGAVYTINSVDYPADGSGEILVLGSWMGQTLSIVAKGNGLSTVNSDAQSLVIPSRPTAPSVTATNETITGQNDGQINDVSTAMEYKVSSDPTWTVVPGTSVTGLPPGAYQVRLKATNTAFAGNFTGVTIATGATQTRVLTVTAPTFSAVDYGYTTRPDAKTITIANSGNSAATITSVTVSPTNAFEIAGSGATVAAEGGQITTWTVQPKTGLGVDTHTATITVTYDGGTEATASVSFTVNLVKETTPNAGIDFENEQLTGLVANEDYLIDKIGRAHV